MIDYPRESRNNSVGYGLGATGPVYPADTIAGGKQSPGILLSLGIIEDEVGRLRNLAASLADRLDQYCDKTEISRPTSGPPTTRESKCDFQSRLNLTICNLEEANNVLRLILDRVQL